MTVPVPRIVSNYCITSNEGISGSGKIDYFILPPAKVKNLSVETKPITITLLNGEKI